MANINLNIKKDVFNSAYYPYLFQYNTPTEIYYGGGGSGKSFFIAQKLVIKALKSKRTVLAMRKVGNTSKTSTFKLILDTLSKFKILSRCLVNKTDLMITLPNGSVFLCKGLDDPEKIKSIVGITDLWMEEATEFNLDEYTQLNIRLRAKVDDLQTFISYNPTSKANWVYKLFHENGLPDGCFLLHTTYKDNQHLPQSNIDFLENMQKINPTYYKIYCLGEFASLDKLVFNNWQPEEFNHAEINGKLLIGLDFGFVNDKTALIASILDDIDKKIYIFNSWGATNKTNDEIANIIKAKGFSKSLIIADCAEQKSIEEIRRCGIQKIRASAKGKDSILHGIQKLQQYQIIVHPSCDEVITELENYSWVKDKSTGEYINKPIDDFNHYIDALRYSLQCVKDNKLKSISKNLL